MVAAEEKICLERSLRHLDPTVLDVLDNAKVSLYFLSELDLADRWIMRFQDATIFIYSSKSTNKQRYRFALFNNKKGHIPISVSILNNFKKKNVSRNF
jgi:hypothetical protein